MSDSSIGINHLIILNKNFKVRILCFCKFQAKADFIEKNLIQMKWNRVKSKSKSDFHRNTKIFCNKKNFKWPKHGLFFIYFRLFKQTLPFLQKINVKNVHPEYGTRIQTHDCWNMSPSPITTRPGLPPFCNKMFDNLQWQNCIGRP